MGKPFKVESRHWMLIVALILAAYASYCLIEPYIGAIILAFIISLLYYPIHERIEQALTNRPNTAAILSCLMLTIIIVIPLLIIFSSIVAQGTNFSKESYLWITNGGAQELMAHPAVHHSLEVINKWIPFASIDPQSIIQKVATFASQLGTEVFNLSAQIVSDATNFIFKFVLMLFVLFFLLRDHDKMVSTLRLAIPLTRSQEDILLDEVEKVAKSAVMGAFLTALAQGVAGGFAMWLAGFHGLFWGSIIAFASFIPMIGTALIWIPASVYLMLTGDWQWALFLVIWSVVIVGSIDNVLRPLLMQGNSGMNTLFIFFSILGGLHLFGLIGVIYGPIIFALTAVLFRLYEVEFKDFLTKQDQS